MGASEDRRCARRSLDTDRAVGDSNAMPRGSDTIILGAGLSGLAAALRLGRGYRLLERRAVPGGLAETVEEGGYRFDRTGHLLHLSDRGLRRWVLRTLDLEMLEIDRRSRIFSNGVYTPYPFQANTHGLPPRVVAECLTGFFQARLGKRGSRRPADFEEYVLAHFGRGIADHFMIPYNRKLWGVPLEEITPEWCDGFVPIPSVEEVVRGAVGFPQERMGYNARFLYPAGGIGRLTEGMARRAGRIEHGAAPTAIDPKRRRLRLRGEWIPYRYLISTIPLDLLARLIVEPPVRIERAGRALRCTSLRYLDVALDAPSGTDHHWAYVPERRYPFYRVGCYSNFSADMAPPGKACLYVELASRRPVDERAVVPRVIEGLVEMGIVDRASRVAFARPRRIRHAYVVYDRERARARAALLGWLRERGVLSIGRYGAWEYSAMEDALLQGFAAADEVRSDG